MSRPRTFMCASQTFATRSPSSPRRAHAPDESLVTLAKRLDVPEGVATAGFTLPEPFRLGICGRLVVYLRGSTPRKEVGGAKAAGAVLGRRAA